MGRAKNIVQLRPRNPESPIRSSIPVKAVCDYRQIEVNASSRCYITSVSFQNSTVNHFWIFFVFQITIRKDEECELTSNSHRAKWKVINLAGNEAMVPSVCFTVPPPNKEAADVAAK